MCVKLNERVSGETKRTHTISLFAFASWVSNWLNFPTFCSLTEATNHLSDTRALFLRDATHRQQSLNSKKSKKEKWSRWVAFRDTASGSQQFRYLFAIAFAFTLFQSHSFRWSSLAPAATVMSLIWSANILLSPLPQYSESKTHELLMRDFSGELRVRYSPNVLCVWLCCSFSLIRSSCRKL